MGSLEKRAAREWMRYAGWCLTDAELDQMLMTAFSKMSVPPEKPVWTLKQLMDLSQEGAKMKNMGVDQLQTALRTMANNKGKISREKLSDFILKDAGLTPHELDELLQAVGLGQAKLIDCDALAYRILVRICNPPSAFEL